MDKEGVKKAFVAAGLSRLVKDLDALARPSIRITTAPVDQSTLKPGTSKLGGLPDLPAGEVWPEWKGVPQSFIAQIRLADLHPHDVEGALPAQGMLWFFYDAQQEVYGADLADRGGWKVLFKEDISQVQPASAPQKLPLQSRFRPCSMSFSSEITLSQHPELEIANFDWSEEEQQKYEQFLSTFPSAQDHAALHHRVLGSSETLQDDMRLQCQMYANGVTEADDAQTAKLQQEAKTWQLLLQVDSDEHAGMRWASTGMLYYWIRQEDLHARHFDQTWLVLQSE